MNRSEFIKRVIKEKGINKTIYLLSKNVIGFPKARKVLNLLDRNTLTSKIITSKNIKEIKEAKELLLIHEINYIQDDNLRNQTKKFIDDLVEEKMLQKFLNSLNEQENKKTNYIEGSNSWGNRNTNNEEDEQFNEAMSFIALVIILFFILIFFANLN